MALVLQLGPMFAIVEHGSHMIRHAPRPEPHGSNPARDQTLFLVLEQPLSTIGSISRGTLFSDGTCVDQHEPPHPATVHALLFQTIAGQAMRSLKLVVAPRTPALSFSEPLGRGEFVNIQS